MVTVPSPLIHNLYIYLFYKAIIKSAGGKCIQNLEKGKPNADDIILAVSCKEDRQQWPLLRQRHPKITIINTEGFMLSIMRQHIDFKRYLLH